MPEPDFITVPPLAERTGYSPGSLYNQHSSGVGPLAPILTKMGGRVGVWRLDYEQWLDSQRRLKSPPQPPVG
jgi:predicted DNA-binding transcriptional regulator AlpA